MQFSLRALLVMTTSVAVLIVSGQIAPIFTLSVLLLAPLPGIMAARCFPSFQHLNRSLLGAFPIALMLFYVGLIGPMCAFVAMPYGWGLTSAKNVVLQVAPIAYPWFDNQVMPEAILSPLAAYQEGWAAWVNPAW